MWDARQEPGLAASIASLGVSDRERELRTVLKRRRVGTQLGLAQEVSEQMVQWVPEGWGGGLCSLHLEHKNAMFPHSWSQQRPC